MCQGGRTLTYISDRSYVKNQAALEHKYSTLLTDILSGQRLACS